MKKVLLLSPPFLKEYMRNARCDFVSISATQWFPIWLGYLGAFLESKGYKITIMDCPSYGYTHSQAFSKIKEENPDLLVVYTGRMSEKNDVEFTDNIVEKTGAPAVFVGPYLSINPQRTLTLSKKVKWAVRGEFEKPILEILEGKDEKTIKNLLYKENGVIKENPPRSLLNTEELDSIPFVSDFFNRHLDFKYYRAPSELHPFIDIMTGRGCKWGRCTFCLWVHTFIKGPTYNTRSIDNVLEELSFIQKNLPHIKSVMIQDDTLPAERAAEISEGILKRNIKITWSCYAKAEIDRETLKIMKKAGCRNLHVGYETSNREVLKKIKKGTVPEIMEKFTRDAKEAGLNIHADFIIGLEGDTKESILQTIQWAKKLDPYTAQFQLMIPFEGTPYYEKLRKNGWLNEKGEPDFPWLSNEELRKLAKKAYRDFYFRWGYIKRALSNPYENLAGKAKTIYRAIPAFLWKRW